MNLIGWKRVLCVGLLVGVVGVTSGCNPFRRASAKDSTCKGSEAYSKAQSIPTLVIPPGLESPDTRTALRVPDLSTPEPPARTHGQGCLDEPPPFTVAKPKEPQA